MPSSTGSSRASRWGRSRARRRLLQLEDQLGKPGLLVDPAINEAARSIEADRPLVGLEHVDEDWVVEQPSVLDKGAAMALPLMVGE
jgi:hypothetical protein